MVRFSYYLNLLFTFSAWIQEKNSHCLKLNVKHGHLAGVFWKSDFLQYLFLFLEQEGPPSPFSCLCPYAFPFLFLSAFTSVFQPLSALLFLSLLPFLFILSHKIKLKGAFFFNICMMQIFKIKVHCLKTLTSPHSVLLFCLMMVTHQGAPGLICPSHSTPRLCLAEISSPSESLEIVRALVIIPTMRLSAIYQDCFPE